MRKKPWQAKGRTRKQHIKGKMNGVETAYSWRLEAQKREGMILDWKFEPIKFRLADKTYFEPDFMVLTAEMLIEFHEIKAVWRNKKEGTSKVHWEDDARVKIKVAAEQYPMFMFRAFAEDKGYWREEVFNE